jgi:hypothetical protein
MTKTKHEQENKNYSIALWIVKEVDKRKTRLFNELHNSRNSGSKCSYLGMSNVQVAIWLRRKASENPATSFRQMLL